MAEKNRRYAESKPLMTFINRDADAARKIALEDDLIDNLYDQVIPGCNHHGRRPKTTVPSLLR